MSEVDAQATCGVAGNSAMPAPAQYCTGNTLIRGTGSKIGVVSGLAGEPMHQEIKIILISITWRIEADPAQDPARGPAGDPGGISPHGQELTGIPWPVC